MPRNGSGVMERQPGTEAISGATASSAAFESLIDDIISGMNFTQPVALGGTGAEDTANAAKNLGVVYSNDFGGTGVVAGTATAITLASSRGGYGSGAPANGTRLMLKAGSAAADGGTTFQLDSTTVKNVKVRQSGTLRAVAVGDWFASDFIELRYDSTADGGTGAWILVNGAVAAGAGFPIALLSKKYDESATVLISAYDSFVNMPLDTEDWDDQGVITIASNKFTPSVSGGVKVRVHCVASGTGITYAQAKLRNVTDGTDVKFSNLAKKVAQGGANIAVPLDLFLVSKVTGGKQYEVLVNANRVSGADAVSFGSIFTPAGGLDDAVAHEIEFYRS